MKAGLVSRLGYLCAEERLEKEHLEILGGRNTVMHLQNRSHLRLAFLVALFHRFLH